MIVVVAIIVMLMSGCSSTRQIAKSATRVNTSAIDIQHTASQLHDSLVQSSVLLMDVPQTTPQAVEAIGLVSAAIDDCVVGAEAIISLADGIQDEVGDIHAAVTQTKDVQNQWVTLGMYIAGAVICACIVFVLWRSGVLALLGGAIGLFHPSKTGGVLAAKVIAEGTASGATKALIASNRTNDSVFDKSYRQEAKRQKEKESIK